MTESDEYIDTEESTSPADQCEQIREQLQQIPGSPSLGDITVAADALADARELAEDEPTVATDLVPEICRLLQRVGDVSLGKGASVLPGEFTGQVYREGMRALAALDSDRVCSDQAAEDRVEHVLEAVRVVLATDGNLTATVHAISVSGTLSMAAPRQVSDALHAETVSRQITELLSVEDARPKELLQPAALLAGHVETAPLVSNVDQAALVKVAEEATPEGRVWLHVLSQELDRDSPVDSGHVWTELETDEDPAGVCWWLLAGYSVDAIPEVTSDNQIGSVLQQPNAEEAVRNVSRLSNRFEFEDLTEPTLAATLQIAIQDGDLSVQLTAVKGLVGLAGEESIPSKARREAIQTLQTGLRHDSWGFRRSVTRELIDLAGEQSISSETRQKATETLQTALQDDKSYVQEMAAKGLADLASGASRFNEIRQEAIQALQTALQHSDFRGRRDTADGLAKLAGRESIPKKTRQKATETLQTALQDDNSRVREIAADGLIELAGTASFPDEIRHEAIETLQMGLQEGNRDVRQSAANGLAGLAGTASVSGKTRQKAIQVLRTAFQDESSRVRESVADALVNLASESSVHSDTQQEIIQILQTALQHDSSRVRESAANGLAKSVRFDTLGDDQAADATRALLDASGDADEGVRKTAVGGLDTVCETRPQVFTNDQSLLTMLGAQLEPASPAPTSPLLTVPEALATHDPTIVSAIAPDLKRLLTKGTSTEIHVQVLELLSQLGEPAVEAQEGECDRE